MCFGMLGLSKQLIPLAFYIFDRFDACIVWLDQKNVWVSHAVYL